MNPSAPFIRRPVATTLFMAAILLGGFVSFRQLPVSALPQVDYPIIQVITFYPGASPDVMASAITAPLERQFGQVPGLTQMTSTSSDGASVIVLQFLLELNIDVAEQEVQAAINAAQTYLPADLPTPPIYSKSNPADAPILTLALTSTSIPLANIEDIADTRLAQKISQVPGVGLVSISGGQKPAVRIQANTTALSSYGLNLEDVRTALVQSSVDAAKGNFDGPSQDYQIDANDQILSSAGYKDVIIAYSNGAPVRVADVAKVVDGIENQKQAAWMDKTPAVILNIQRQPGANIIQVVDNIQKLLGNLKSTLPAGIKVTTLTDRTTTIRASVEDVEFELLLTIVLVVLVIFLFLRSVPATLIPSVAVPLSLIGTFAVMYVAGFSLNNLTLMALTIATGFVVDDAIVMIENIVRYLEEGEEPMAAALKGAEQIGFTIVSLTVSLIAVLIPLLAMGDIVGRLFREFAITLSVTILISAVVSLTLTPMMCARLLKHDTAAEQTRFYRWSEAWWDKVIDFYAKTLRWVLRHQTATLWVAVGTLVFTVFLYIIVPKGFFPIQDTGVIQGISEAAPSSSFAAMAEKQQLLVAAILKHPGVASLSSFIGIDGTNTTLNSGRIQINLKPYEERGATASEIIRDLQPELAKIEGVTLYLQPVQDLTVENRASRTQYQYTLSDPNPAVLSLWTGKLLEKLRALPELTDVATDLQDHGKAAELVIDRATASRLGITPAMIDNTLYDAFGQRQISTMYTQLNQYHVVLETLPEFQRDPSMLQTIYIRSPSAQSAVPLSAFSHFELRDAPLSINHQGQFPVVTISFNLSPKAALGDATEAIERAQKDLHMPLSTQGAFQGSAASFQASLANQPWLILAALVTVYLVLGILYESFIHPVTILSTLPSAGAGALLALLLTGMELSMVSLIGVILLIGIVKKNGIMMIDFALDAERHRQMKPAEAIYQACLLRFRPILMTTMAALLAGIPLAMGSGIGSELRKPLGVAMVGGLLVSQVLTLYTTPVIYIFFANISERFAARRQLRAQRAGHEHSQAHQAPVP